MSFFGGSATEEQKSYTENAPWAFSTPFIKEGLNEQANLFHHFQPTRYANQVAGFAPAEQQALMAQMQRAIMGSPLEQGAQGVAWDQMYGSQSPTLPYYQQALNNPYFGGGQGLGAASQASANAFNPNPGLGWLGHTASGGMLDGNPYLDNMYNASTRAMTEQYRNATAPSTQAAFAGSGRLRGGNAAGGGYNTQMARNEDQLMQGLEDAASNIYGNAYNMERGLQEQAASNYTSGYNQWIDNQRANAMNLANIGNMQANAQLGAMQGMGNQFYQGLQNQMNAAQNANQFANIDYTNIAQLMNAGNMMRQQNQRYLDDAAAEHEYYQTGQGSPYTQLARYWNPAFAAGQAFPQTYQHSVKETEQSPGIGSVLTGLLGKLPGLNIFGG